MIIAEGTIGRMLATGMSSAETDLFEQAAAATSSWINTEIPKLKAQLATWRSKIPATITQAQAKVYSTEFGNLRYAYGQSWKKYVETPYAAVFNNPGLYPTGQLTKAFSDAYSAAFAVYTPFVNEVLLPAARDLSDEEFAAQQAAAADALRAHAEAWNQWTLQSDPLIAELDAIFQETRDPYWKLDMSLVTRADAIHDSLNAIATTLLSNYGGPAWRGTQPQKNLARAREMSKLAWERARSGPISVAKVRQQARDAGQEYGYDVDEFGNITGPVPGPESGFGFGMPLAILGGLAAIFLIRRARK